MRAKRVVIYVDDETDKLDLVNIVPESGVIVEVRRSCREGDRHFTDPVVTEIRATSAGAQVSCVDTRIEP